MAAAERLFKVLDVRPTILSGNKILEHYSNDITFNHVGFAHGNSMILSDINFTIPHGKIVAFVGRSGSGKSTIHEFIIAIL